MKIDKSLKTFLFTSLIALALGISISSGAEPGPFPKKAQVTGDFLQVRETATIKGVATGVLFKNMIVTVLGKSDQPFTAGGKKDWWYHIKTEEGKTGWVFGGFLDFTLAHKNQSTYEGNPDLSWFFKKYGKSTYDYDSLNPKDFNLDNYRSLLSQVKSGDSTENASYALLFSAYREYQASPESPRMVYLRPILFSPQVFNTILDHRSDESSYDKNLYEKVLHSMPQENWKDSALLKDLHLKPDDLTLVDKKLMDDESFVEPLVKNNGCYLPYLSTRLLDDKAFLLKMTNFLCCGHKSACIGMFENVSDRLRDDYDLAVMACREQAPNLDAVSDRIINDFNFWEEILKVSTSLTMAGYDGYGARYEEALYASPALDLSRIRNPQVIAAILQSSDIKASDFGEKISALTDRALLLTMVKSDGLALDFVSDELKNDKEFVYWATLENPAALEFASAAIKGDRGFVTDLIAKSPGIFQYASEDVRSNRTVALSVINKKPEMVNYLAGPLIGDNELSALAMEISFGKLFPSSPEWIRSNKSAALVAVKHSPEGVCSIEGELKEDKEVALVALANDPKGETYRCLSEKLRADPELALMAVKKNFNNLLGRSYQKQSPVPESLKRDKPFALDVVREAGWLLKYFPEEIRADKEVALEAIDKDKEDSVPGASGNDFAPALRDDADFMLQAIQRDSRLMEGVSPRLKDDEKFVDAVLGKLPLDAYFKDDWLKYKLHLFRLQRRQ